GGAGSSFTANGLASIGDGHNGSVTVSAGGLFTTQAGADVGSEATGVGEATVSGTGATWNNTGNLNVAVAGTGTLNVSSGGAVSTTGTLSINDPAGVQVGTLNFNGGTITTNGITRAAGGILNWADGTLR